MCRIIIIIALLALIVGCAVGQRYSNIENAQRHERLIQAGATKDQLLAAFGSEVECIYSHTSLAGTSEIWKYPTYDSLHGVYYHFENNKLVGVSEW